MVLVEAAFQKDPIADPPESKKRQLTPGMARNATSKLEPALVTVKVPAKVRSAAQMEIEAGALIVTLGGVLRTGIRTDRMTSQNPPSLPWMPTIMPVAGHPDMGRLHHANSCDT